MDGYINLYARLYFKIQKIIMLYNANNELDKLKATERLKWLISNGKTFELTEKKRKRSYKQNRYLHLLLAAFGLETGYTLNESKLIYKKVSIDLYKYEKNGQPFLKSSADLNTQEMTTSIERFRNYSNTECGLYLPSPDEVDYLNQIEQELTKYESKIYL